MKEWVMEEQSIGKHCREFSPLEKTSMFHVLTQWTLLCIGNAYSQCIDCALKMAKDTTIAGHNTTVMFEQDDLL